MKEYEMYYQYIFLLNQYTYKYSIYTYTYMHINNFYCRKKKKKSGTKFSSSPSISYVHHRYMHQLLLFVLGQPSKSINL